MGQQLQYAHGAPRPITGRCREASVLAPGSLRSSPSRGFLDLSGFYDVRSPVTVAGAAAVSHRVPIQSLWGNLARAGIILITSGRSIRLRPRGTNYRSPS